LLPVETGYHEFELLNYFRQFQISEQVDQEKIRAEFKGGVLTLMLPKAERAKPKQITVSVAA
jgi:HSP20 family protein